MEWWKRQNNEEKCVTLPVETPWPSNNQSPFLRDGEKNKWGNRREGRNKDTGFKNGCVYFCVFAFAFFLCILSRIVEKDLQATV